MQVIQFNPEGDESRKDMTRKRIFEIIEKSDAFVNRVSNLITEAKKGFAGGVDVNVHIFSGLGGGTGAGTFLDVCYLVQKALDDIGEGGHALTLGYFFLPDVNLSVPQVAANPNISGYIMPNGFAVFFLA